MRNTLPDLYFHISNNTGDNAHLTFTGTSNLVYNQELVFNCLVYTGTAVSVSGIRDFTFGRYNVTLDGVTTEFDAQSFWKEETTLFFQTGLDPATSHTMIITNAEQQSLAIGAINVTSTSGSLT